MRLTYDQISSITEKHFIPKLVDNIFRSRALTERMLKKGKMELKGGSSIMQPVLYATSNSQWFENANTLNTADVDQMTAFEFNWKQLQTPIVITRIDELKNSGDAAKLNFVKEKTRAAEMSIRDALGDGIFNDGTSSSQVVGLRAIIDDNNTYGGIDRSTYSWAQAQLDSTTTTFSIAALQALAGDCTVDTEVPTVYVTTQAIYNRYFNSLQPQQRFMDDSSAKAGFKSLMFSGAPFIVDHKAPANYLAALNEEYLKLVIHQDENFRFRPFQEESRQAVKVARIFFAGALVCSNPRLQGAMDALSA
jgi:hypothetical protein